MEREVGGRVVVGCVEDGSGGQGGGGDEGGGDTGGGGGGDDTRECTWRGAPISCGTATWVWYQAQGCYARVADPQPDVDHPAWDGHEPGDGVVIACIAPSTRFDFVCDAPDGCGLNINWLWAPGPPGATGPSPIELARQALASMQLTMGQIGVTGGDPEGTGWRSVIGLPIWLWVDNPAPNTIGPITASASDSGLTVTATATLDRIEWTLTGADGVLSTTCAGPNAPGTVYEPVLGDQASPTCGWSGTQIQRADDYTLTGTAYWTVEWTGGSEIGTLDVDPIQDSIQLKVIEVQSLRTDGG